MNITMRALSTTDSSMKYEITSKGVVILGKRLTDYLAKLQPAEQEQALSACFREDWNGGQGKAKRILLPARHLHQWIEQNILLILKDAPSSKTDPNVNPAAEACVDCPKRPGGNALLFADIAEDACTDPACYQSKLDGFVAQTIAVKPQAGSNFIGLRTGHNRHRWRQRGPSPQQVHRDQAARPQREEARRSEEH